MYIIFKSGHTTTMTIKSNEGVIVMGMGLVLIGVGIMGTSALEIAQIVINTMVK